MRVAATCPTCATYTDASCVMYKGCSLYLLGTEKPPVTLEKALKKIDEVFQSTIDNINQTTEKLSNKSSNLFNDRFNTAKYPTTAAVYSWVSTNYQPLIPFIPENVTNKSADTSLGTSDTLYPTQKAVKTYIDAAISTVQTPNLSQVLTQGDTAVGKKILIKQGSIGSETEGVNIGGDPSFPLTIENYLIPGTRLVFTAGGFAFENGTGNTNFVEWGGSGSNLLKLPNGINKTLALSVNGNFANSNGDITISGINQNLQQVTDIGNSTDNDIVINNGRNLFINNIPSAGGGILISDPIAPASYYTNITAGDYNLGFYDINNPVNDINILVQPNRILFSDSSGYISIMPPQPLINGGFDLDLPQGSGTFALSVNGVSADNFGNITLPAPSAWLLTGNSGTNPSTNFIGTTGAQDLVFKTNNVEYLRFNSVTGNNNEVSFLKNIKLTGTNSQIWVSEDTNGGYVTINADAADRGKITIAQNLSNRITIKSNNITGTSKTLQLPNATGTFALSVNNNAANTSGNVSVNLQSVLSAGNSLSGGNNFQGTNAGVGNTGNGVIAFGTSAGFGNTGSDVIGFGLDAAGGNTGTDVTAFGTGAAQGNQLSGVTVFSNLTLPTYANHAAALLAITVALGATSGNTYLYHNQATNSIGAVRL